MPAGGKSSLGEIRAILGPNRTFEARETYDTSKSSSWKDVSKDTGLQIVWPMVDEKLMITRRIWVKIEYLRYIIKSNFRVLWPREMNEAWKFTSWAEQANDLKSKTIQNIDEDETEG